ncbi:MAG: bifunctional hydroxymethylpyrimidine kinase/phosphomethylpyrimidine kinase [bacterium]|nr:bifunctional hydroxymethylpyrimidine kinase/phosphomethylpyrimidine kinase [bacterium]
MNYKGKALTIAGSDSSGGAGIQADLKTFQAFDVYGMSVVTSVTAQNTLTVKAIYDLPKEIVTLQMDAIFEDISVDAVKTGMLSNEEIIETVADRLSFYNVERIIVDPVMVSKSKARLLRESAEKRFIELIVPLAFLITPNIPEAEVISGIEIRDIEDMKHSARKIKEMGAKNVLIKGGHLEGNLSIDILFDGETFYLFEEERIPSKNTHGTGCTFSSAITACLARGENLYDAIKIAKQYITTAIREAPNNIGKGFGPLYHNIRGIL